MQVIFLCKCWQLARLSNFTHSVLMTVGIVTIHAALSISVAGIFVILNKQKDEQFQIKDTIAQFNNEESAMKSITRQNVPSTRGPKIREIWRLWPLYIPVVWRARRKNTPTKSIAHEIRGFLKFPAHCVPCTVHRVFNHESCLFFNHESCLFLTSWFHFTPWDLQPRPMFVSRKL